MQAVRHSAVISIEDYLAGEAESDIRHEYVGGVVYAMAGASYRHNRICGTLYNALDSHMLGKPCRVFILDVKVQLQIADQEIFYYPDVGVACDPRSKDPYIERFPKVLVEVLSSLTERTDRREKFLSYTQIETLEEYVLVAQEPMEATVFRRTNNWRAEVANRPDQKLQIRSVDFAIPLSAIYARCEL